MPKIIFLQRTCIEVLVDDEDYRLVKRIKWFPLYMPDGRILARANLSRAGGQKPGSIFLHRFLMRAKPGEYVDHKDRNTLNNTRGNLRKCTLSQNAANKKSQRGAVSKMKGVSPRKDGYRARITFQGNTHHLGDFKTETEAAKAYDAAAVTLFGRFARTNRMEGLLDD